MKNLEELLWKEKSNMKEEGPTDGTQVMNHACIAICCIGGGGMRYTCCPSCTLGVFCR